MKKYKEIFRLKEMLEKENIPFVFRNLFDGFQICYPVNDENRICSVIEHNGSYGHKQDKLEIMGLMTKKEDETINDVVIGYLTAKNVFKRIKKHYKGEKKHGI